MAIAYYHHVGPVTPWYAEFYAGTTAERLERDLERLARWFRFAPLAEVVAGEGALGGLPPLAVTFDDGFDLVASGALDVLERHGVTATTFVITSCVGNGGLMWRNKLSAVRALRGGEAALRCYNEVAASQGLEPIADAGELMGASRSWPMGAKDELADALWQVCAMPPLADFLAEHRPYLGWDELRGWIGRGHGVGLHTRTHPYCARLSADEIEAEVVEPAALVREQLGVDWLALSYPFGSRLEPRVERELFERGVFDCALGIEGFAPSGRPPYRLERATAERDLDYHVWGKAFVGRPR